MSDFENNSINLILAALVFLIISISTNQIAILFQKIKLHFITGLIFVGGLVRPFTIGLVPLFRYQNALTGEDRLLFYKPLYN